MALLATWAHLGCCSAPPTGSISSHSAPAWSIGWGMFRSHPGRAASAHTAPGTFQTNYLAHGSRSRAGSQRFPRAPHSLGIIHLLLAIKHFLLTSEGQRSLQTRIAALCLCLSSMCASQGAGVVLCFVSGGVNWVFVCLLKQYRRIPGSQDTRQRDFV